MKSCSARRTWYVVNWRGTAKRLFCQGALEALVIDPDRISCLWIIWLVTAFSKMSSAGYLALRSRKFIAAAPRRAMSSPSLKKVCPYSRNLLWTIDPAGLFSSIAVLLTTLRPVETIQSRRVMKSSAVIPVKGAWALAICLRAPSGICLTRARRRGRTAREPLIAP